MLIVETIARIRREHFIKGKTIREIARDLKVSRNTVRKVLRSGETSFEYERVIQPRPKLGRTWRLGAVATTANHFKRKTSLIQLLAQFRIELVPIDRLIERDGSAFSLEIREDDGRPRTRGVARTLAGLRHDLASSDHIPRATGRCGLRSRSELIQYCAQIFAHFFLSVPAEVFSRRLSRLSVLMMNVQLKSRIVHFDLGHPYRRSAFAKIVSHPDVAGQKSVRGGLGDASCRGHRGKSPGISFSRSSIRRHRGDGGAEERRGKHDWKRGVHGCAA